MTIQTVEAVYEHGLLRLLQPPVLAFHEGQRVRIVVDTEPAATDVLTLATSIFDGLSEQDVHDIEQIARERTPFFGDHT